jgi:hypothetical protein
VELSPEAQRIAIAEACGYVWYRIPQHIHDARSYRMLAHPRIHEYEGQSERWLKLADGTEKIANWKFMEVNGYVPDYLHDLNAMHNAEWELGEPIIKAMRGLLWEICGQMTAHSATAAQRAEAFLKAIGNWTD